MLGNLVGGLTFVGLTLYATHARPGATRGRSGGPGADVPQEIVLPAGLTPARHEPDGGRLP